VRERFEQQRRAPRIVAPDQGIERRIAAFASMAA
jgi:hypothetical protein